MSEVFDTKIAIVLRDDLMPWQALNVTAFLTGGITAQDGDIIGESYKDRAGNTYNALIRQPIIVLSAAKETLKKIHERSLARNVKSSLYIEEMFSTGHDEANRAVFAEYDPENASVVGIGLHADKKLVDKIIKGAKMHK
ncbi:DUF2000 family protein [Kiloniella antarctica]|uniref:DUF2000 family protein n=1 Tax=Kiloniella antarctica TaxID=1550907 RepID=A0ABW5BJC1_9PROT